MHADRVERIQHRITNCACALLLLMFDEPKHLKQAKVIPAVTNDAENRDLKGKCHIFSQKFFKNISKKLTTSSSVDLDSFDFASSAGFFGGVCGDGNGLCEAESIFNSSFELAVLCSTSISVPKSVSNLLPTLSETIVCVVVPVVVVVVCVSGVVAETLLLR